MVYTEQRQILRQLFNVLPFRRCQTLNVLGQREHFETQSVSTIYFTLMQQLKKIEFYSLRENQIEHKEEYV